MPPPPPHSRGGEASYLNAIWRRLNRDRGKGLFERGGGLFNLEKMMVLVLHKELEYKVEKLKYKKVEGHAAKDQDQIRTSSW